MMRVLHVHAQAKFCGGVEQILHDMAAAMRDRGWPQALLHGDETPAGAFTDAFDDHGQSAEIFTRFAPDLVVLHRPDFLGDQGRLSSFPCVHMVHDHDLVCLRRHKYFPRSHRICPHPAGMQCVANLCIIQQARPGSWLPISLANPARQRAKINRSIGSGAAYIVGSDWMKSELAINGFPISRIHTIAPVPHSLDMARPLPLSKENLILYVGQLIRGKGVDLLLKALSGTKTGWRCSIVGTGNHQAELEHLASRLGIADRITFHGWVAHGDIDRFYQRAAICVVPSRWPEPFGMVGIEAMARGRPVIGFRVGGITDWLEHEVTGLCLPPADIDAMARAIDRLLSDRDERQRMGAEAILRIKREYRFSHFIGKIMALFEQVNQGGAGS